MLCVNVIVGVVVDAMMLLLNVIVNVVDVIIGVVDAMYPWPLDSDSPHSTTWKRLIVMATEDSDDDWVVALGAALAVLAQPIVAIAKAEAKAKAKTRAYTLPHWSKRSPAEHHLAACKMRLAKK